MLNRINIVYTIYCVSEKHFESNLNIGSSYRRLYNNKLLNIFYWYDLNAYVHGYIYIYINNKAFLPHNKIITCVHMQSKM